MCLFLLDAWLKIIETAPRQYTPHFVSPAHCSDLLRLLARRPVRRLASSPPAQSAQSLLLPYLALALHTLHPTDTSLDHHTVGRQLFGHPALLAFLHLTPTSLSLTLPPPPSPLCPPPLVISFTHTYTSIQKQQATPQAHPGGTSVPSSTVDSSSVRLSCPRFLLYLQSSFFRFASTLSLPLATALPIALAASDAITRSADQRETEPIARWVDTTLRAASTAPLPPDLPLALLTLVQGTADTPPVSLPLSLKILKLMSSSPTWAEQAREATALVQASTRLLTPPNANDDAVAAAASSSSSSLPAVPPSTTLGLSVALSLPLTGGRLRLCQHLLHLLQVTSVPMQRGLQAEQQQRQQVADSQPADTDLLPTFSRPSFTASLRHLIRLCSANRGWSAAASLAMVAGEEDRQSLWWTLIMGMAEGERVREGGWGGYQVVPADEATAALAILRRPGAQPLYPSHDALHSLALSLSSSSVTLAAIKAHLSSLPPTAPTLALSLCLRMGQQEEASGDRINTRRARQPTSTTSMPSPSSPSSPSSSSLVVPFSLVGDVVTILDAQRQGWEREKAEQGTGVATAAASSTSSSSSSASSLLDTTAPTLTPPSLPPSIPAVFASPSHIHAALTSLSLSHPTWSPPSVAQSVAASSLVHLSLSLHPASSATTWLINSTTIATLDNNPAATVALAPSTTSQQLTLLHPAPHDPLLARALPLPWLLSPLLLGHGSTDVSRSIVAVGQRVCDEDQSSFLDRLVPVAPPPQREVRGDKVRRTQAQDPSLGWSPLRLSAVSLLLSALPTLTLPDRLLPSLWSVIDAEHARDTPPTTTSSAPSTASPSSPVDVDALASRALGAARALASIAAAGVDVHRGRAAGDESLQAAALRIVGRFVQLVRAAERQAQEEAATRRRERERELEQRPATTRAAAADADAAADSAAAGITSVGPVGPLRTALAVLRDANAARASASSGSPWQEALTLCLSTSELAAIDLHFEVGETLVALATAGHTPSPPLATLASLVTTALTSSRKSHTESRAAAAWLLVVTSWLREQRERGHEVEGMVDLVTTLHRGVLPLLQTSDTLTSELASQTLAGAQAAVPPRERASLSADLLRTLSTPLSLSNPLPRLAASLHAPGVASFALARANSHAVWRSAKGAALAAAMAAEDGGDGESAATARETVSAALAPLVPRLILSSHDPDPATAKSLDTLLASLRLPSSRLAAPTTVAATLSLALDDLMVPEVRRRATAAAACAALLPGAPVDAFTPSLLLSLWSTIPLVADDTVDSVARHAQTALKSLSSLTLSLLTNSSLATDYLSTIWDVLVDKGVRSGNGKVATTATTLLLRILELPPTASRSLAPVLLRAVRLLCQLASEREGADVAMVAQTLGGARERETAARGRDTLDSLRAAAALGGTERHPVLLALLDTVPTHSPTLAPSLVHNVLLPLVKRGVGVPARVVALSALTHLMSILPAADVPSKTTTTTTTQADSEDAPDGASTSVTPGKVASALITALRSDSSPVVRRMAAGTLAIVVGRLSAKGRGKLVSRLVDAYWDETTGPVARGRGVEDGERREAALVALAALAASPDASPCLTSNGRVVAALLAARSSTTEAERDRGTAVWTDLSLVASSLADATLAETVTTLVTAATSSQSHATRAASYRALSLLLSLAPRRMLTGASIADTPAQPVVAALPACLVGRYAAGKEEAAVLAASLAHHVVSLATALSESLPASQRIACDTLATVRPLVPAALALLLSPSLGTAARLLALHSLVSVPLCLSLDGGVSPALVVAWTTDGARDRGGLAQQERARREDVAAMRVVAALAAAVSPHVKTAPSSSSPSPTRDLSYALSLLGGPVHSLLSTPDTSAQLVVALLPVLLPFSQSPEPPTPLASATDLPPLLAPLAQKHGHYVPSFSLCLSLLEQRVSRSDEEGTAIEATRAVLEKERTAAGRRTSAKNGNSA